MCVEAVNLGKSGAQAGDVDMVDTAERSVSTDVAEDTKGESATGSHASRIVGVLGRVDSTADVGVQTAVVIASSGASTATAGASVRAVGHLVGSNGSRVCDRSVVGTALK